ncbi:MAG TPA: hypothetical protein VNG33_05940 [Polyangiaceae bacterium]|nr:hypothetical protein [Polyangiaceae bacterium]
MDSEQGGISEAYRAPAADYDVVAAPAQGGAGYVVSSTKLVVLYVATFGLYGVYWFFKHWKDQQLRHRSSGWPIARAIFSVFYVTQLFKAIDLDARMKDHAPSWNPGLNAAVFIGLTVAARILDRAAGTGGFSAVNLIALLMPMAAVVPLVAAQNVANSSYGDAGGRSNSSITAANIVSILFGLLLWALIALGVALRETR